MTLKKLTTKERVNKIFDVLKEKKLPATIKDISDITGYHNSTTKHYLELIELIQNQKRVIIIRTGSSYQISL